MFNFRERPYNLFLFTAMVVSLVLVFLSLSHTGFRDNTMFLVPLAFIIWIIPLLLLFFWVLYLLTRRFLYSNALTRVHVFLTVFTVVLILAALYLGINPLQPAASRYYDTVAKSGWQMVAGSIQIVLILLICGQCIYIVNVLLGVLVKKRIGNAGR